MLTRPFVLAINQLDVKLQADKVYILFPSMDRHSTNFLYTVAKKSYCKRHGRYCNVWI